MIVYLFVYLLTLLLCNVIPSHNQKDYLQKLIIIFIPLFLFGALREGFSDLDTYEGIYNEIHSLSSFYFDENAHSEIGYQWLCYVMPSFRSLLVFTAALMCFAYAFFFYKNIPPQGLTLAITMLFLSGHLTIYFVLSSLRNGIAMSLFILCFSFWQDRKIIPAALVTVAAMTMHTSAIFSFPLAYLVGRDTPFSKKELFIWVGVIVFFILSSTTSLIELIAPLINNYFDRYDSVIELGRETGNTSHPLSVIGSLTLFGLLAAIINKDSVFSGREKSTLRVAMIFSIALIMTALNARMSQYYSPLIVAATSIIYTRLPQSNLKKVYISFVIAYIGYFFYLWIIDRWFYYGVYHSILGSF